MEVPLFIYLFNVVSLTLVCIWSNGFHCDIFKYIIIVCCYYSHSPFPACCYASSAISPAPFPTPERLLLPWCLYYIAYSGPPCPRPPHPDLQTCPNLLSNAVRNPITKSNIERTGFVSPYSWQSIMKRHLVRDSKQDRKLEAGTESETA